MNVIQITSKSTNTLNDSTDTTSQTMQHVLIPQTSGFKDASVPEIAASATSPSTQQSSSKPLTALTTYSSLNILDHSLASKPTEYTAHIPYNPIRPPPYTYQRQHEFPPFPPLTRHPVLPFLTTAFADQGHMQSESSQLDKHYIPMSTRPSTGQRSVQNHTSTIPTMDVSKNDPTAIFIHPPFVVPTPSEGEDATSGTGQEPAPGTPLTYALLHAHRNWFLDPDDFGKDNPNRVDYPAELEPPRGWAPLNECINSGSVKKQKDRVNNALRTKGSYGTPEPIGVIEYGPSDDCHELTVLRCTFCRREYHGPNAKSMWRRHVYDKHKVAMKNRREGSAGSAIRNLLKKPKSKGASDSFDMPAQNDPPNGSLDLTNEQNIIRLLERAVSGDLHLNLPASVLGGGNTINLQTIANALQRSGITISVNDNNLEIVSPSQSEFTGSQSMDSDKVEEAKSNPDPLISEESAENPKKCDTSKSSQLSKRKIEDTEKAKSSIDSERTPLKDHTFADRSYHNSAITPPGTPRKDKTKQKIISKSPVARLAQNPVLTPVLSPPRTTFGYHYHHRSLTSTALRARALATTGQESYLTFLASSPSTATNSPIKSVSHMASPHTIRSSPFFRVKNRDSGSTGDDLGILGIPIPAFRFPFDFQVEASDNFAYTSTSDPVEVDTKGSGSLAADLAPPAQVDEKPSRLNKSTPRTSKAAKPNQDRDRDISDELESERNSESSPLQRLPRHRRFNKNDDKDREPHEEDFDMDHFLDLKDSGTGLSSAPSTPQKITLPSRGFAKEFGLLSQEEVERITASLRPDLVEDLRSPKRRRLGSPL